MEICELPAKWLEQKLFRKFLKKYVVNASYKDMGLHDSTRCREGVSVILRRKHFDWKVPNIAFLVKTCPINGPRIKSKVQNTL